jgi:hypothetical protein
VAVWIQVGSMVWLVSENLPVAGSYPRRIGASDHEDPPIEEQRGGGPLAVRLVHRTGSAEGVRLWIEQFGRCQVSIGRVFIAADDEDAPVQ